MPNTEVLGLGVNLFAVGPYMARLVDHDGPTSYTSPGGETITALSLGFKRVLAVFAMASDDGTQFAMARIAAKKTATSFRLLWYLSTTGAEIANATNLSARSLKLLVIGIPS